MNWAEEIHVKNVWTAVPRTVEDVVLLANWATQNGYKLRPRGYMHTWAPIVLPPDSTACEKVILIDTTKYLIGMRMESRHYPASVTVQTGASLDNLLVFLEENGFGIMSHPASGDLSVGGMLAVGAHGTGLSIDGQSYGSISNLVVSLNAIVWNEVNQTFEIRTFPRSDPATKALLVNLGRIFLSEVTLRVTRSHNLECISRSDIPPEELFADPREVAPATRTISKLLHIHGALEITSLAFTPVPWLKTWTVQPKQPEYSRHVRIPYNYPLTDNYRGMNVNYILKAILSWNWRDHTKLLGQLMGIGILTAHPNLWGPSKNVLLYVQSTTIRTVGLGYVVITHRRNLQLVINRFTRFYNKLLESYADNNLFPVNLGLEIRVTGVDNPDNVGIPNAEAPILSPVTPVPGRPDLNTAIWFNIVTITGTRNATNFKHKLETFLINIPESLAVVRPEWSKSWAYTGSGAWKNSHILHETIPSNFKDWKLAMSIFNQLDPQYVFTNSFLESLMQL